jgi:hypothetical protein
VIYIVYRIQDADGRGPWKPGFSNNWVEAREDHKNLTPWLEEFGPVHLNALTGSHLGCACKTVDQLKRWFTVSEYQTLLDHGYSAVRLRVDRILAESDKQCVVSRSIPLRECVTVFNLYPKNQISEVR